MTMRVSGIALLTTLFTVAIANADDSDIWIPAASGCMVSVASSIAKTVTVNWTGTCSDGYADGKGVLTWSNGNRYEGELVVGTINGKGTFYWANGDWYEGEFKRGRREGMGTQHFGCNGTYHGQFHNGVMDGLGVLNMADGNHYEGTFHNGQMDGLGFRKYADGSKYQGEFKNNQREGLGTVELPNHFVYEGEYRADQLDGHVLMTDEKKTVYEGSTVAGHVEGRGVMTKQNGERDIGIFKEAKDKLKLVSNIGPPLYEPCSNHCSDTTLSCTNMQTQISGIRPDDPQFDMKAADIAATCGRDLRQCVTMCDIQNPTVRELRGIVEVGEMDDMKSSSTSKKDDAKPEPKSTNKNAALSFVDEQMSATRDLRKRLTAQQDLLERMQYQIAKLPTVATTAGKVVGDCKPASRHNKS